MARKFRVLPDETDMYLISVVDSPAIESDFITMSEQERKKPIAFSSDEKTEKYMMYGPVLIPDKDIYRNDDVMGEYYISFSAECIEKMEQRYIGQGYNTKSWNINHGKSTNGLMLVESWIKAGDSDKSVELGLDVPVGTWLVGVKCDSIDVWNKAKNGEINGFSIEAYCSMEEIEARLSKNKEIKDSEKMESASQGNIKEVLKTFSDAILSLFPSVEKEEVKEEVKEELSEVVEKEEKAEENVELSEQPKQEELSEQTESEEVTVDGDVKLSEQDDNEKLIESLQSENDDLKAEIEKLKAENQKLSKQPSVNPNKVETKVTFSDIYEYRK